MAKLSNLVWSHDSLTAPDNESKVKEFIFAIEVVKGDVFTLEARERYWIDKLCTITRGLNSNRTQPDHLLIAIIFKKLHLQKYSC